MNHHRALSASAGLVKTEGPSAPDESLEALRPEVAAHAVAAQADGSTCSHLSTVPSAADVKLSEELARAYEELSLLHNVAKNLQVSRDLDEVARIVLEGLGDAIEAEGLALLWYEADEEAAHDGPSEARVATFGDVLFSASDLGALVASLQRHGQIPTATAAGERASAAEGDAFAVPSRPLVCNRVARTAWGSAAPGVRQMVLVPLAAGRRVLGWLFAFNRQTDGEFGTVEASLTASMATILATHAHNLALWRRHEELLVAVVRTLVNAIDAKDPYTCGHSERVAGMAREIGRSMNLGRKELRTLFLSGLLHDIGKIGIDDAILRKPGALTREEFARVKEHPVIGYQILAGLRELRGVLPGVRWHHERFDGHGYPDGLAAEEIPLSARILAVADAYDAMGSHRPYRKKLAAPTIDTVFRKGAGTQWDPRVLDAFFRCRESLEAASAQTPTYELQGVE